MAPLPLSRLEFVAASVAEELGFIALADLAAASPGEDSRVIGGHMVSLHALRWKLDLPRETIDADLGPDADAVITVLDEAFGRDKPGIAAIRSARGLSPETTLALETRIQALVSSFLPSS